MTKHSSVEQRINTVKQQYLAQNKSFARSNSQLLTKVAELESQVNSLLKENITVRTQSLQYKLKSQEAESKIEEIETYFTEKFNEMLSKISDIKGGKSPLVLETKDTIEKESVSVKVKAVTKQQAKPQRVDTKKRPDRRQSIYIPATAGAHDLFLNELAALEPASKVKHSVSGKVSKHINEQMPQSMPTRRTRGKQVDYTQPSLRVKMRKPFDGFVDATTKIDMRELQFPKKNTEKEESAEKHQSKEHPEGTLRSQKNTREERAAARHQEKKGKSTDQEIYEDSTDDESNAESCLRTSPSTVLNSPVTSKVVLDEPKRTLATAALKSPKKRPALSPLSNNVKRKLSKKLPPIVNLEGDDLSAFDLIDEVSVGVPKRLRR